jgi:hypothetical protein
METMIKGYHYKSNKRFSGDYEFPNNLDKEEIHMPPNTTLVAPPTIPAGKEALWDGKGWSLVDEELPPVDPRSNPPEPEQQELPVPPVANGN